MVKNDEKFTNKFDFYQTRDPAQRYLGQKAVEKEQGRRRSWECPLHNWPQNTGDTRFLPDPDGDGTSGGKTVFAGQPDLGLTETPRCLGAVLPAEGFPVTLAAATAAVRQRKRTTGGGLGFSSPRPDCAGPESGAVLPPAPRPPRK